jgi:hypothetical protein
MCTYNFNHWFGPVHITVDGEGAASRWRMLTISPTQRFEFAVSTQEHHDVVIEETRKSVLGGFRSQTCPVIVDTHTVSEYRGSMSGKTTTLWYQVRQPQCSDGDSHSLPSGTS